MFLLVLFTSTCVLVSTSVTILSLSFSESLKWAIVSPPLFLHSSSAADSILAGTELFPASSLSQTALVAAFSPQAAELAIKFLSQSQSMEVTRTVAPQLVAMKKYSSVRAGA